MKKRIYLASPHMSDEGFEQDFVKEAFDTNWIAPLGPNVNNFEIEIANKVGVKSVAVLNSGTSAIHLALKAVGVDKGDEVIVQSFTFAATVNPILYQNATPIFIDSDYKTWNMDPNLLERALEENPNVKAVIIVHLYGISAEIDRIADICKKHKVALIEDAAESLGTVYKGKYTGTFGDFGIYSFNGNKIITTSGGGCLISNDAEKIEKCKFWATQSRDQAIHYQHSEIGYNYRMSNVVAGVGRGQLKVLDNRVNKKREIFDFYSKSFRNINTIEMMPQSNDEISNCWLTSIIFKDSRYPKLVIEALNEENIESRPLWKPMHIQPVFDKYKVYNNGVCEDLFNRGLCLPSDTKLSIMDLEKIASIVRKVCV